MKKHHARCLVRTSPQLLTRAGLAVHPGLLAVGGGLSGSGALRVDDASYHGLRVQLRHLLGIFEEGLKRGIGGVDACRGGSSRRLCQARKWQGGGVLAAFVSLALCYLYQVQKRSVVYSYHDRAGF